MQACFPVKRCSIARHQAVRTRQSRSSAILAWCSHALVSVRLQAVACCHPMATAPGTCRHAMHNAIMGGMAAPPWLFIAVIALGWCHTRSYAQATNGPTASVTGKALYSSGTSASELTGRCACDVTEQTCDANCCCDPSCSDAELQRFTTCDTGLEAPPTLLYCVPDSQVVDVRHLEASCWDRWIRTRPCGEGVCMSMFRRPQRASRYWR
jgi:Protein of unknown function (DUF1619)